MRAREAAAQVLFGEPLARKELSDLGFGVRRKVSDAWLEAQAILPNFVQNPEKDSKGGEFSQKPYCFRLNALQTISTQVQVFAGGDFDFPSEITYSKPVFTFSYESYKPNVGAIWNINSTHMIWIEGAYETTDKEEKDAEEVADDFTTDRTFYSGRL